MNVSDLFTVQNLIVGVVVVCAFRILVRDAIHFYYCRRAKRLQKPVCRCWDCAHKCELYKLPK